ncbi:hypothetical protein CULT_210037 [[Clostridium] ultunense Esp]|nr:hypothetical protein CULT_210037 [[Clostridium] ultunense Esp]
MVELLSSMRDQEGRITIEGFYDRVKPLSEKEREEFKQLNQDEERLREELGVPSSSGRRDIPLWNGPGGVQPLK